MSERLARGWDAAAAGYEAYYVPRFAPWVAAAVRAVTAAAATLPDGPVAVPCCGTFPELDALRAGLPGRPLEGIDLSAGMLRHARERAAGLPDVTLTQGDASALEPGRYAAVVSVFGLQQLPDPAAAVAGWVGALRPGGRLSVVFWPRDTEDDGPFARIAALTPGSRTDRDWEERLPAAVSAHGARTERDEVVAFPMTHPDAASFFDAHVHSGPMRPLLHDRGAAFVQRLRAEFLRDAPAGRWRHHPRARHVVAVRHAAPPA